MLEWIIERSARNKLLVILTFLLITSGGVWATLNTPVDAIPDLSDVQVIVRTDYPGQGPQIVEDQVTYPLASALMSVAHAHTVRGYSMFGASFIYVIFDDGTDLYWARSRVLEYLSQVSGVMPEGVKPALGPDATGVGWVYQYSLSDTTGTHDLAQLRSIQDFFLKYELQSIEGVAEVATVGGFEKQYQIVVDPQKLNAYGISLAHLKMQVQRSNSDVGGRLVELGEREYIVRGKGYLRGIDDIKQIPLMSTRGTTVTLDEVARVQVGPELRRGIAEKDGLGEVVGGIIVMRNGENATKVISRVKSRLAELAPGLPYGVEVVTEYDRSGLIDRAVGTLSSRIWEELLVVALIVILFLLHFRSALVAIIAVFVGILIALGAMYLLGINANIMSLGGIAIAIGVMVDASLVMVENAHKHIERARERLARPLERDEHVQAVIAAAREVGPSIFFSLLIVTVAFLPVFTLGQVEGRMFRPLAFTKTFAMAASAILAVTLVPALMVVFVRGNIRPESRNPITRGMIRAYRPMIRWTLKHPWKVITATTLILVVSLLPVQRLLFGATLVPFPQIGSEFMPELNEGDLLYMPSTLPGIGAQKAKELLQQTDRIIASFPEVKSVFGKIGRAETATDPAPLSMVETTVVLKDKSEWRVGMTYDKLVAEMDAAIQIPGVTNAWTMPIKNRIDMLATGIKTPVGVKVAGSDLKQLERIGEQIESVLLADGQARSVFAERVMGGSFLDFEIDRGETARYGLTIQDVQDVIQTAIGGMTVTTTVEGLERYPVNIRYPSALRNNIEALRNVLVATGSGAQVPLGQLATFRFVEGPPMIKSENARPNAWIYVDLDPGQDVGSYVRHAKSIVADRVNVPAGYSVRWSGQYESIERANQRLQVLVPITIVIIFILLLLHFRSVVESTILMVTLPFAVVGAVWLLSFMDFNMSIAVAVGLIAVAGLAAETGVVMQVYLDEAVGRYRMEKRLTSRARLNEALEEGAVERVRPKLMTVTTTILGLVPVMVGTGTGSEIMKRIAAPMVGGLVSSTILTLIVIPAIYAVVQGYRYRDEFGSTGDSQFDGSDSRIA